MKLMNESSHRWVSFIRKYSHLFVNIPTLSGFRCPVRAENEPPLHRATSCRTPDLRVRVLSLALCFFVNSIVSYGMYQSVDIVTGSRYAAAAIMGVGKVGATFFLFIYPSVFFSLSISSLFLLFSIHIRSKLIRSPSLI